MRGLAILEVLLRHLPSDYQSHIGALALNGGRGVDLFFCLSGFLMGRLIPTRLKSSESSSERPKDASRRFLISRAARVWPLYFAFLLAIGLGFPGIRSEATQALRQQWPLFVLFLANFKPMANIELSVVWSLCVEEFFYLLLFLLILGGPSNRFMKRSTRVAMIAIIGAGVFRWVLSRPMQAFLAPADLHYFYYFSTPARIDQPFFGLLAGLLSLRFYPANHTILSQKLRDLPKVFPRIAYVFFWLVLIAVELSPLSGAEIYYHSLNGMVISSALLGLTICDSRLRPGEFPTWCSPLLAPLAALGRVSFAVYLIHLPVRYWLNSVHLVEPDPLASRTSILIYVGWFFGLSILIAWILSIVLERPLRQKIRVRFGAA